MGISIIIIAIILASLLVWVLSLEKRIESIEQYLNKDGEE